MMRKYLTITALLLFVSSGWSALAQEAQTGTIEQLDQDNGSITISGKTLVFSELDTQIFLGERLISSANIDPGMVVRYTLDESGKVLRIELMGPSDLLSKIDRH